MKGGIRLSYSKNPLGVRTPTNTVSGGNFTQQQGSLQTFGGSSYTSMQDAFSHRPSNGVLTVDLSTLRGVRRDQDITSPVSSHHYAASPPRFFSPPPPTGFGLAPQQAGTALPRLNNVSNNNIAFNSSFSPFGSSTPPYMTPQVGSTDGDVNTNSLTAGVGTLSTSPNLEPARAA